MPRLPTLLVLILSSCPAPATAVSTPQKIDDAGGGAPPEAASPLTAMGICLRRDATGDQEHCPTPDFPRYYTWDYEKDVCKRGLDPALERSALVGPCNAVGPHRAFNISNWCCPPSPDASTARPIVGAIRWDAWVGDVPGYDVGRQVERSLGPKRWHYRLPFFATEISDTQVQVRSNTQAVMDREIEYARAAGIDYWAFVMYAQTDPATKGGLDLYLQSKRRRELRFAMIVQSYTFGDADIDRLVRYFARSDYQTVASGRPLVFLLGPSKRDDPSWPRAKESVDSLRAKTAVAGIKTPYIVHQWGWDGAKDVVNWLGLDAIGAYAMHFDDEAAPFSTLAHKTEHKWDEWSEGGAHAFPVVMSGWDRRPRVEHPVSWEAPDDPKAMARYYEAPTPAELAAHLRASLDWCRTHPQSADAQGVLIYAWNELDEGGWLVPSLWPEQGTKRLDAVRAVLRP